MDFTEGEIIRVFTCLNANSVSYILVGGFAVNVHGFNRSTGDIDLWLADTEENRKSFVNALTEYGIDGAEVFHTLPFIAAHTEIVLDNGFVVDVMADLQFFKQDKFNDSVQLAKEFKLADGVSIRVLHLNALIEEKENSNREKDKLDAKELRRINKLL